MKSTILITACILLALFGLYNLVDLLTAGVMERAYFEGQKDALNGSVRIKKLSDSTYHWVKSPWDGGRNPSYQPTYLESQPDVNN